MKCQVGATLIVEKAKPHILSPFAGEHYTINRHFRQSATRSLHCHALGQVARLIHVAPRAHGHMVGEQLQWHDVYHR
jgi:hypothetical protein